MPLTPDEIDALEDSLSRPAAATARSAGPRRWLSPDEIDALEDQGRGGYGSEFARGMTQVVPSALKSLSVLSEKQLDRPLISIPFTDIGAGPTVRQGLRAIGLDTPENAVPEARPLYKYGQRWEDVLEQAYPSVPEKERNLGHDVSRGLGQVGSMIAGGMVAKGVGAGARGSAMVGTLLGSAQEFPDAFERSRRRGDDPDTAFAKALGYTTVAALIENKLGAGRILRKYFPDPAKAAKKLSAWGISKAVASSVASGFGEEASQRFAQNWIVEGKPSLEGVVEEGAPGGIVQAIAELPAHLLRGRGGKLRRSQTAEDKTDASQLPPAQEEPPGEVGEAGPVSPQLGQPAGPAPTGEAEAGAAQPQSPGPAGPVAPAAGRVQPPENTEAIRQKLFENMQGREMDIPLDQWEQPASPHLKLVLGDDAPSWRDLNFSGIVSATKNPDGSYRVKVIVPAGTAKAPPGVSIPLIITKKMEQDLANLGYGEAARNKLTPERAQEIIRLNLRAGGPTGTEVPAAPAQQPPVGTQVPQPGATPPQALVEVASPEPNGAVVEAEYQIWPVSKVLPLVSMTPGEFQNLRRAGVKASSDQKYLIATKTDWRQIGTSDSSMLGGPLIDVKVIAGNNRAAGIAMGYALKTPSMLAYEQKVRETAPKLGLSAEGIDNPVLVRVVRKYIRGDRRQMVEESNKMHVSLPPSKFQKALDDATALKKIMPLDDYPLTENGNLDRKGVEAGNQALSPRGLERNDAGVFDVNELNTRFKLAVLLDIAQKNNFPLDDLAKAVQSDEGKRYVAELLRFAPRLNKLDADISFIYPWLEALERIQEGIRSTPIPYKTLAQWNQERHSELEVGDRKPLSPEADFLIDKLVLAKDKPTLIRDLFDLYLIYAEREQQHRRESTETGDIFSNEPRKPVSAGQIIQSIRSQQVAESPDAGGGVAPGTGRPVVPEAPQGAVPPVAPEEPLAPVAQGKFDISDVVIQPGQERTWLAAAKSYYERKRAPKARMAVSSLRGIRGFINSLLNEMPALSTLDLSKATDEQVEKMIGDYFNPIFERVGATERGKGSEALRGRIREFRAVMDEAKNAWSIPANRIAWAESSLKPISKAVRPYIGITGQKLERLTEIFRRDLGKGTKSAGDTLEFFVRTGLRLGSAMMIRWRDVDFTKRTIDVLHYKASQGGERTKFLPREIPMTRDAYELLKKMRAARKGEALSDYVLTAALISPKYEADGVTRKYSGTEKGGTDTSKFINALRSAGAKAGVVTSETARGLTVHWLRSVFQNFASASLRDGPYSGDRKEIVDYLRIETKKGVQARYDADKLARIKAAAKLIRFDFDPGYEDIAEVDEDEDVEGESPEAAAPAAPQMQQPQQPQQGKGVPPLKPGEKEATLAGGLKLGVSAEFWKHMAGFSEIEQMREWGTTASQIINDAVMKAQKPNNPDELKEEAAPQVTDEMARRQADFEKQLEAIIVNLPDDMKQEARRQMSEAISTVLPEQAGAPGPSDKAQSVLDFWLKRAGQVAQWPAAAPAAPVGMTPQQQSRYANLIRIERAAERGGSPMSAAQRAELEQLRAIGTPEMPGMPPKAPPTPKQGPDLFEPPHLTLVPEGWGQVEQGEQEPTLTREEVLQAVAKENTFGFRVNVISHAEGARMMQIESGDTYKMPENAAGMFYDGEIFLFHDRSTKYTIAQNIREEAAHGLLRTPEGSNLLIKFLSFSEDDLQGVRDIASSYATATREQLINEFVAKSVRENQPWWRRAIEAVRVFLSRFGLQLTNEEAARALLKEIQARIGANTPVTSDEDLEASFAINTDEPTANGADDVINVAGREHNIMGKDRMTPQMKIAAAQRVVDLFQKLEIPGEPDTSYGKMPGSTDRNMIFIVDPTMAFPGGYEKAGNALADEILKQILIQGQLGGDPSYVAQLINAVHKNFNAGNSGYGGNWGEILSKPTIDKLMAVTMSESSKRGQNLRALTGMEKDPESIGRNFMFHLKQVLSDQFGGADIRRLMERVLVNFRDWITEDELNKIMENPNAESAREQLERLVSRVVALNRRDEGGRIFNFIQRLFKPKFAKTIARMEKDDRVIRAVEDIVEKLKAQGIQPKPPVGKKNLTALESLLYMVQPEVAVKITDSINRAIHNGYMEAGKKYALDQAAATGGPDARAELEAIFQAGKEPEADEINEGLKHAEYAHWKTLHDVFKRYDPITAMHAQKIISEQFRGTENDNIYGVKIKRPKDTRLDFYQLAKDPDAYRQQVISDFLENVKANIDLYGADAKTQEKVAQLISDEYQRQLALAQERVLKNFLTPPERLPAANPVQRVQQLTNAGLAKISPERFNSPIVQKLLERLTHYELPAKFFGDRIAMMTNEEKQDAITRAAWAVMEGITEITGLPETDEFRKYAEQVVLNDLSARVREAELKFVRRLMAGGDVNFGNTPVDPEKLDEQIKAAHKKLAGAFNAGLFMDPDHPEIIDQAVRKSFVQHKILPTFAKMVRQALETPFYEQEDIFKNFAENLIRELDVNPEVAEEAKDLMRRAYASKFMEARKVAMEQALSKLTPSELRPLKGRTARWRIIEQAINAGAMDDLHVMEAIAIREHWKPVTEAVREKFKELVARMDSLRELNEAELAKVGDDEFGLHTVDKSAATEGERIALMKQIETLWARMSAPINLKTREGRMNTLAAANEWTSANLLWRFGFPVKQSQDIFSQMLFHTPTRAIQNAWDQYVEDKERNLAVIGMPTQFWKDVGNNLKDAYKTRIAHWRETLSSSALALKGQSDARNVERLLSSVATFDRMAQNADEAWNNKEYAWATLQYFLGALKLSYRTALAFDNFHGTPAEWQEMRQQAYRWLRDQGIPAAKASMELDGVLGNAKEEYYHALETAKQYFASSGIDPSPTKLRGAAANITKARAYQKLFELGMPADAFAETGRQLRNVIGWNEKETGGFGGAVAGAMLKGRQLAISAGHNPITTPFGLAGSIFNFGNAIGTTINRVLTFSGLGFFPALFGVDPKAIERGEPSPTGSPWYRTQADRTQRKLEASAGLAIGVSLLGLAAKGLLRVRNKWPKDKEERELFERQGHRPGTVEFPYGDGYAAISMTSGPLAMVRPYLAAGGAIYDLLDQRRKAQEALNAEAAKKGLTPGKIDPTSYGDLLAVAAEAAQGAIAGGRTASGLIGAYSDYGVPNLKKISANIAAPYIPWIPAMQEISRMGGVKLDAKMASFADFLLPLPTSGAVAVNMFGDRVGTPNDLQRVVQVLTGGNYPYVPNEDNQESAPYRVLFETGYRPPSISSTKGYEIDGQIRPLTDEELAKYTRLRGKYMKETIGALGPGATKAAARAAYQQANAQALREIGAAVDPQSSSSVSKSPLVAGTRSTRAAAAGYTAGYAAGSGGGSSRRYRSSNLRGFSRPRLTGGRARRLRRSRIRSAGRSRIRQARRRSRIRQYA